MGATAGRDLGEAIATRKDWRGRNSPKSARPVAPEIPADSYMTTGDPVYHRQGSTAIGYESSTLVNFDLVKPKPGMTAPGGSFRIPADTDTPVVLLAGASASPRS